MVIKMLEGDTDGARRLQLKYIPLIHALFCEVNPIPVKAAMNMLGYQAGTASHAAHGNGRGASRDVT